MQPAPAIPASSLILVREAGDNLEVYLTKRNPKLNFLGGFYAFLGGRRDEEDFSPQTLKRMWASNLKTKAEKIDSDEPEDKKLGYYATAIREAFEEAGILIVKDAQRVLSQIDQKELFKMRTLLHQRKINFLEIMERFDFYYDLDQLFWFAHWITPKTSPKRFDTQFFVSPLPIGQDPQIYKEEVASAIWLSPEKALQEWKLGKIKMIPPTLASLDRLTKYKTIEQLKKDLA